MEKLIGKISQWMGGSDAKLPTTQDDVQTAAAALMVHAMRVDVESRPEEAVRVKAVLAERFAIDGAELDTLIARGEAEDDNAVDLYRFTKVLAANLDQQGREGIVRMLWEVVTADDEIHEFESNLVWRVSELIGVPREDRIRLRQEVLASGATSRTS